jgi:hypothetical protein
LTLSTVKAALRHDGYQLVLHGHLHHGALVPETNHDHTGAARLHIAAAPTLGSEQTQEHRGYHAISIAARAARARTARPDPGPRRAPRPRRQGRRVDPDGAVLELEVLD